MMYIIMANGDEHHYHKGKGWPIMNSDVQNVIEIQADGNELNLIKEQITGIPMTTHEVVNWFGDDARFIASNLKT